ncbi:heparan-alpha-glucosaminide N-acetyltransferase isoform X1 [Folsomia candida]|uniref:heparan-alpha-glucosaminide N-acetyltransferase isoform X1 n=1 Tax=Folsomia candida TaxID=158441 RepID=UPI000B8FD8FC|nr:heparan-alpha-glucosaminide N-acetyltransferase isoform X1 [Folsomia candida]
MSWFENPGVETFNGLKMSDLSVDEAWLIVSSSSSVPLWLYSLSENCHHCPFQRYSNDPILPNASNGTSFKISSTYDSRYRLRTDGNASLVSDGGDDPGSICQVSLSPGEFGVYELLATPSQNKSRFNCSITTHVNPVNIYYPLFIFLASFLTLIVGILLVKTYKDSMRRLLCRINPWNADSPEVNSSSSPNTDEASLLPGPSSPSTSEPSQSPPSKKKGKKRPAKRKDDNIGESTTGTDSTSPVEPIPSCSSTPSSPRDQQEEEPVQNTSPRERLSCLDAFRGICIVIMIFVDDGGGLYYFFEHCTWDGLYVADLAFPWFLWVMGVCIPISIHAQKQRRMSHSTILSKICTRSLKLVLIGIFIINTTSKPNPAQLGSVRIPGVLQRLGVSYFAVSILVLYFYSEDVEGNNETETENQTPRPRRPSPPRHAKITPWIIILLCVVLHTCIIFFLPVPGCPTGYLGPGGLHLNNKYSPNCIGGATGYVDKLFFTKEHIYQWPTAKKVYNSGSFDPEGSLGLLTSFFQVWLGVQLGVTFLSFQEPSERLKRTLGWSLLCVTTGLILSGGLENTGWIPVNKNLWSLSFVLITSGFAYLLVAILYVLIDIKGYWTGFPFLEAGMNSILLYMGHEVFQNSLPWNFTFGRMSTHFRHLVENVWGTCLWVVISVYLYRKKMFLVL